MSTTSAAKATQIINRTNNVFELISIEPILSNQLYDGTKLEDIPNYDMEIQDDKHLRLKGQMIYMESWNAMMYLGTPVMPDLNSLIYSGLYINDLSMHDFSRDLMLAGTQQSVELKLALDQEQQKSKKLEESMRRLDEEMKRTDELLYQMIPKQVADRLRAGENAINTCEMFDNVSILFSDVVTFTEICTRISPMQVVSMLNGMYSIFDRLSEQNKVYKVETIGDAYMVVSGAPQRETDHAERVCKMALDMVDAITTLQDPSTGKHLEVRIGVHSGAVVAGVVGLKMPRYCLFGDSVNIASKMESTSESMKIHISQPTKDLLPDSYRVIARDKIYVKEKGFIKTYWLQTRNIHLQKESRGPHLKDIDSVLQTESPARPFISDKTAYTPVMYYDMALGSVNSSLSLRKDCSPTWTSHNPADLFGSEVSYSIIPAYHNSQTSKHTSEKKDNTPLEDKQLLTPTSKHINSLTNESRATDLINPSSIKAKLVKAPKMLITTRNNDETNLHLNKLKRSNHNRKYSSSNGTYSERKKWDKKSKEMLLVSFNENIKGYRLYDPKINGIVISRDVIVIKNAISKFNTTIADGDGNVDRVGDETTENEEANEDYAFRNTSTPNNSLDENYTSEVDLMKYQISLEDQKRKHNTFNDYVTLDEQKWKEAKMEEMKSFEENGTWELTDLLEDGTIVECKWEYKVKHTIPITERLFL
ncbi:hypothetical protein Trydic_g7767 [Trypoxylus dichotomus]